MADLHVIAAELSEYLAEVGEQGFALGERDCCTLMADWLLRLGFPDVMADRRGCYSDVRAFRRLLMAEGGLVAACHRRFSGAGLSVTTSPRAGDVAVILEPYARRGGALHYRAMGSIALNARHFAVIRGLALQVYSRLPIAKVWTVHA
jgi:hypothetical protein